jgi:hypothetical protein
MRQHGREIIGATVKDPDWRATEVVDTESDESESELREESRQQEEGTVFFLIVKKRMNWCRDLQQRARMHLSRTIVIFIT